VYVLTINAHVKIVMMVYVPWEIMEQYLVSKNAQWPSRKNVKSKMLSAKMENVFVLIQRKYPQTALKKAAQIIAMEYASISMVKKNVSATMVEHLQSATLLMDLVQG
jgi:hypothetical protein